MQIGNDCNPITGYLISHPFGSNVEKYEHRIRAVFSDHIRHQLRRCPSLLLLPHRFLVLQNGFHSLQDREKILIADGEKRGAIPFPRAHSACYSRARGSSLLQTFAHNKTNGTQTFEREWIIRRNYIELSSLYFLFLSFRNVLVLLQQWDDASLSRDRLLFVN